MYLYYMYLYINVFVLYVLKQECICIICNDILMYLYCMYRYIKVCVYMYRYINIFVLYTDTHSCLKSSIRLLHLFSETVTSCIKTPQ